MHEQSAPFQVRTRPGRGYRGSGVYDWREICVHGFVADRALEICPMCKLEEAEARIDQLEGALRAFVSWVDGEPGFGLASVDRAARALLSEGAE